MKAMDECNSEFAEKRAVLLAVHEFIVPVVPQIVSDVGLSKVELRFLRAHRILFLRIHSPASDGDGVLLESELRAIVPEDVEGLLESFNGADIFGWRQT